MHWWLDKPLRNRLRVSGLDAVHCSRARALHTRFDRLGYSTQVR